MEFIAFQSPLVLGHYSHVAISPRKPPSPLQNISDKYKESQISQRRICGIPVHCAFDGPSESSIAIQTDSDELISDAPVVTVRLPLGAYLEETTDGRIFVDELVTGGNAETSRLLLEGDVITAVSLPFGDSLFPVPDSDGLEMIASYIESREGDTFRLAVVRTYSLQDLRSQSAEKSENAVPISKHLERLKEIHVPEYPIQRSDESDTPSSDTDFVPDFQALRESGFDFDGITDGSQRES